MNNGKTHLKFGLPAHLQNEATICAGSIINYSLAPAFIFISFSNWLRSRPDGQ